MLTTDVVRRLVDAVRSNDVATAASLIAEHPELRDRINEPLAELAFGATLLHAAVARSHREMIALLVAAGADPNGTSHWWAGGFGVFESADAALVPFLLEQGARMTIHGAARLGLRHEVERLLDDDASLVHARAGDGKTALHYASSVEIARLLVERGATIDARDVDHESTPAQYLVTDHPDVARWLVEQGAHEDILMAAALGDLAQVRRLLDENPAVVDVTVSSEHFPMRHPRAGGSIYIWTLGTGRSPHQLAHERGHVALFDLLMERTPPSGRLAAACDVGDDALCDRILALDPAAAQGLDDRTLMRIVRAAERGDAGAVRRFLRAGWPAGAVDDNGATALHWAAYHGDAALVRDLLSHRASLDVVERRFGGTPLAWVRHALRTASDRADERRDVVALLVSAGAGDPENAAVPSPGTPRNP